jgi:tRNA(fMet)-specific endonuclease VapC
MKYFLDTNVLMHFANDKVKRDKISARLDKIEPDHVFVSSITLYEVHTKLIKNKVSKANVDKLAEFLTSFNVRNFNTAAAITAAKVRAQLESEGEPIGTPDQLLAGHAKSEKATVVTNNTKDFMRVYGLKIEDWTD